MTNTFAGFKTSLIESLLNRAEVDEKRLRELEDTVRVKNKQIHQLLEDIEQVRKHQSDWNKSF